MEVLSAVGLPASVEGRQVISVSQNASGFVLYGPYWKLLPGDYEVRIEFVLQSSRKKNASSELGVRVDVSVDLGSTLVERRLSEQDLWRHDGAIVLPFTLPRYTEVEIRVESTGAFPFDVVQERQLFRNGKAIAGAFRYSKEFEDEIALKTKGDSADRSEPVFLETYGKLVWVEQFMKFTEQYVNVGKGMRFLEAGCGSGITAAIAAMRGADVFMTEIDPSRLRNAQSRLAEMGYEAGAQIWDLRQPNPAFRQAFDFVWCNQILEHIPRPGQMPALRNLLDWVAPGGHLYIDTENRWCPYDAHDTKTWLLRLLNKPTFEGLVEQLGCGINFFEPSSNAKVVAHDYMSYDEIVGAATVLGFEVLDSFMPHGSQKQYFKVVTGSDWFHEAIGQYFDLAAFCRISVLLKRTA